MLRNREIGYPEWLNRLGLLVLSIILTICFFNYSVDVVGIFHTRSGLLFAAKSITQGQMVAGFRNIDEGKFQQLIIENDKRVINTIVLGSSRSMELRGRLLESDKNSMHFFNHSVSGASLEDYIAIIGLYKNKRGYIPKKVILGVDPWVFNKNAAQTRWQSIKPFCENILEEMYGKKPKTITTQSNLKYKQLVTYDYTIANVKALLIPSKKNQFYITNTNDTDDTLRESDGSIHYPYKYRFRDSLEIQQDAKACIKYPVYSLEQFNKLSNIQFFEDFIGFLIKNNVEIIIFLPPYHPLTYELLTSKSKYSIIRNVEEYLRDYSSRHNIQLVGSYDAGRYNLESRDFFDGMHFRDTVLRRLWNHPRNGTASPSGTISQ